MTTRRAALQALAGGLLGLPFGLLAQRPEKVWRIGGLASARRQESLGYIAIFDQGLHELGYLHGKNVLVEWRFAEGDYERLPDLATELLKLPVDVLVTLGGSNAALAAQKATKSIPIVFVQVGDPVALGLVKSLAHPGGNATGVTNLSVDTAVKQLEMLRSLVPGLARVAYLRNPANPFSDQVVKALQTACQPTRTKFLPLDARTPTEIAEGFSRMSAERPGALIVGADAFIAQQRNQIAELAAALRLPSIGSHVSYVEAGGLMSYGSNPAESFRRAAAYVDRILKGTKPADLPVEQPTRLLLAVNRKTARTLGLTIPPELLLLADKVIE